MPIALKTPCVAYQALPKAACSSVKQALAQIDPRVTRPRGGLALSEVHDLYPTVRFQRRAWDRLAKAWRFCVVRDPAKRLMSCYTDIVQGRDALRHSPRLRRRGDLPLDPDADTFFTNLARYRARSSLVKHHALGAELFLGRDFARNYNRVFRTSELSLLAAELSERSGRWVVMPRANRSEGGLSVHDLSGAAVDAIRPYLDGEYALLAAYFPNPLGARLYGSCAVPVARVS